jgi:hypothetical protein
VDNVDALKLVDPGLDLTEERTERETSDHANRSPSQREERSARSSRPPA